MTRLELVRSGGVAGLTLRATVDTAAAGEPDAAWFEEALAGVDVAALAGSAASAGSAAPQAPGGGAERAPGRPDRFGYRLVVERGGERHELRFGEQVPAELRPVVDRLVARAKQRS